MAREEGVEEIVVGLTYSISPVHTHAYYAERVASLALPGSHGLTLFGQWSRERLVRQRGVAQVQLA